MEVAKDDWGSKESNESNESNEQLFGDLSLNNIVGDDFWHRDVIAEEGQDWSDQKVREKAWCESQKFEWNAEAAESEFVVLDEEDLELEIEDIGPRRRSP